jgi:hypothetical protein
MIYIYHLILSFLLLDKLIKIGEQLKWLVNSLILAPAEHFLLMKFKYKKYCKKENRKTINMLLFWGKLSRITKIIYLPNL